MTVVLSEQIRMDIDVAIYLSKKKGIQPEAVIDRKLVDLLIAIDRTSSIQKACSQLNCSDRYAQRLLKQFMDRSGVCLVEHHGQQGSCLSVEGKQCIALYVAARDCMEQLVKEHAFPRALPPLSNFPSPEDWNHRSL